jgi:hypothetical protein
MESYAEGQGGAAAPKKSSWVKWLALGCGGALVLVAAFVFVLFFVIQKATAGPEAVIKEFLADAGAGRYAEAYAAFSAPLKTAQSQADFEAGVEANPALFQVKDTTFTNRSVDLSGAELSGTVSLETGTELPATFKLVRENDEWKLIAYHLGTGD